MQTCGPMWAEGELPQRGKRGHPGVSAPTGGQNRFNQKRPHRISSDGGRFMLSYSSSSCLVQTIFSSLSWAVSAPTGGQNRFNQKRPHRISSDGGRFMLSYSSSSCLVQTIFSSLSWASVTKLGVPRSRTAQAVRGPGNDFTCSAEVNSACAKVFADGENACTRKARPALRGPDDGLIPRPRAWCRRYSAR